jgi:hypothetical protein
MSIKITSTIIQGITSCKLLKTFNGLHGVMSQKIETLHSDRCENLKFYILSRVGVTIDGVLYLMIRFIFTLYIHNSRLQAITALSLNYTI